MEDIGGRQKKELKALDGEKRAAIKKAKGVKGKKGKEMMAGIETEFEAKLKLMQDRHKRELEGTGSTPSEGTTASGLPPTEDKVIVPILNPEMNERERKQEKARRKREAKKEKERQRRLDQEKEAAEAGPSARQIELDALESQLRPLSMTIKEIPSDGNCLYRAIAAQCEEMDYTKIRDICATVLEENEAEYGPFCEYSEGIDTFSQYVDRVRSSSDWGGHLELRASSVGLRRSIVVFSATRPKLTFGDEENDPILLSYHLHYYSLGEHYNQVVRHQET